MKRFLIAAFFLLFCGSARAEEKDMVHNDAGPEGIELPMIIVTPTKYETSAYGIPSSFSVISQDEIASQGKPQVKDILKNVPGINVAQAGSFGSATSIFTRGTESSHTLVMIDGVKVFDPISVNASFNFANLTLDNVERVEVLRGPHSTLYGSDAIGGVINVITKKGTGKPKGWASFESGSFGTFKEAVGVDGDMNGLAFSAAIARLDTSGVSKADEKLDNTERDGYKNTAISARGDWEVCDLLSLGGTFRYTDSDVEIDDGGGNGGDDPNRRNREKQTVISGYADLTLTDWWNVNAKLLWMGNERFDKDKSDDKDGVESLDSEFKGRNVSYELHNVFRLAEFGTLSAGMDYDQEEGDSYYNSFSGGFRFMTDSPRTKNHNVGYYLQSKLNVGDKFYSLAGFRLDDHSDFGLFDTYKVSAKYIFDTETSVKGGWATGFKAPSLFQLFDPSNGNASLKPEKSESFEAGIGQDLLDKRVKMESTYFYTKLSNLIDFVLTNPTLFIGQYQNVNSARIQGLENIITVEPAECARLTYSYTYLRTENRATRQSLNRRPRHKHVVSLRLRPFEGLDLNVTYFYTGNRKDIRFVGGAAQQIILEDYHKVDLSARYVVNEYAEIFARVENLLDKHYQEVDGYGSPGISFYAGSKVTF